MDWSKYKVAELKDECRHRLIPITGLKLKQQFIDALEAAIEDPESVHGYVKQVKPKDDVTKEEKQDHSEDLNNPGQQQQPLQTTGAEQSPEDKNSSAAGAPVHEQVVQEIEEVTGGDQGLNNEKPPGHVPEEEADLGQTDGGEALEHLAAQKEIGHGTDEQAPAELREEDGPAKDHDAPVPHENEPPTKTALSVSTDGLFETEPVTVEKGLVATDEQQTADMESQTFGIDEDVKLVDSTDQDVVAKDQPSTPSQQILAQSTASTPGTVPMKELVEDQRKRKRRSNSPVLDAGEMAQKKARLDNEATSDDAPADVSVNQLKAEVATERAEHDAINLVEGDEVNGLNSGTIHGEQNSESPPERRDEGQAMDEEVPEQSGQDAVVHGGPEQAAEGGSSSPRQRKRNRSPSVDRDVAPALHPATRSIYIRNFKRPLHIPTLRNHVVSLARSSMENSDSDPLKLFYLDPIRTHAFITFSSISEASRVRRAMHDTRFPDEPLREPLFVDFIPDQDAQDWIDHESSGRGKRFEVVYEDYENGVRASLQDADSQRIAQNRPPLQQNYNRGRVSQTPQVASAPTNVHPERTALLPREPSSRQRNPQSHKDEGKGFKALDDLFSHTTAKPKLYYKPVPKEVAEERLDKIQGLRVGHTEMGRSGDPDMKRYTFEQYRGKEEWADRGPEFGYGRKGQDRLAGVRGRGGFRGGGGGRYIDRDRPMDSYRG